MAILEKSFGKWWTELNTCWKDPHRSTMKMYVLLNMRDLQCLFWCTRGCIARFICFLDFSQVNIQDAEFTRGVKNDFGFGYICGIDAFSSCCHVTGCELIDTCTIRQQRSSKTCTKYLIPHGQYVIGPGNSNQANPGSIISPLQLPPKKLEINWCLSRKMIAICFHTLKEYTDLRTFQIYPFLCLEVWVNFGSSFNPVT